MQTSVGARTVAQVKVVCSYNSVQSKLSQDLVIYECLEGGISLDVMSWVVFFHMWVRTGTVSQVSVICFLRRAFPEIFQHSLRLR